MERLDLWVIKAHKVRKVLRVIQGPKGLKVIQGPKVI
jgi:hypothetical protein